MVISISITELSKQVATNSSFSLLCDELYLYCALYRYQSPRAQSRPKEALDEHKIHSKAIRNLHDEELGGNADAKTHLGQSTAYETNKFNPKTLVTALLGY